jgi:hypothetical protein
MKNVLYLTIPFILLSCNTNETIRDIEFDWMPEDVQWQHNIRECRSQPQCNPADLFNRNGYINTIARVTIPY